MDPPIRLTRFDSLRPRPRAVPGQRAAGSPSSETERLMPEPEQPETEPEPGQPETELEPGQPETEPEPGQPAPESATPKLKQSNFVPKRTFKQKYLGGLRVVLRFYLGVTVLVLLINISCLAWGLQHYRTSGQYGTIYRGDCSVSKSLNTWLHLGINILSTGLLLGSSAYMAVCVAPTRKDVDKAHTNGKWLSIGLLTFHNFPKLSSVKLLACVFLALSSVPVHLFYNSVIFPSLSGNDYFWAVVTRDFLEGAPFNVTATAYNGRSPSPIYDPVGQNIESYPDQWQTWYSEIQRKAHDWERLDNENCLSAYGQRLVPDRRNVVLVSPWKNATNSLLAFDCSEIDNEGGDDPTDWLCSLDSGDGGATCDASQFLKNPQAWEVYDYPILYCLSETANESCAVKYSLTMAIVVIVCNAVKLVVEFYLLTWGKLDEALSCVGDAIASFLGREDPTTRDLCLRNVREVQGAIEKAWMPRLPQPYKPKRPFWASAISSKRWALVFLIPAICTAAVALSFAIGLWFVSSKGFPTTAKGLWDIGFGEPNPKILIASDNFGSPLTLSLLANTPQLILAGIYFLYSAVFTALFTAQEYTSFASEAHTLRVSTPAGTQRGTWLLSMPFAWGAPWVLFQTLLHWFVSQGLFVVDVSAYNEDGALNTAFGSILNCGFSPIAMLFAMIAAAIMMLGAAAIALRRFPAGTPPVLGNNSAVISAACHPRRYDASAKYQELKWGVISSWHDGVGHCSFSAVSEQDEEGKEVQVLIERLTEGVSYK